MPPIILAKDTIKVRADILGTPTAWAWVGFGFTAKDNDDTRVHETRAIMDKYYTYLPYGMWIGNRIKDGVMVPFPQEDGYYIMDVSWWPSGNSYRFNMHTGENETSPEGSPLRNQRDGEVSWMDVHAGWNVNDETEKSRWVHMDENGAGGSFRILILPDRTILPMGDGITLDNLLA